MMDLAAANSNIDLLCTFIEERQALAKQFPLFNSDVDVEEPMETGDNELADYEDYLDSAKHIGAMPCKSEVR